MAAPRKGIVQSVSRALDIINYFDTETELGITELTEKMGLSKSSVFGLVNTLATYGYLEQTDNKRYRLGIKLFEMGKQVEARMDFWEESRPYIKTLAEEYQTTAHLATYSDNQMTYIGRVEAPSSLVSYSQLGKRTPMYCTATGKVILANLPREYTREHIFPYPMEQVTETTVTDHEAFLSLLDKIQKDGYSLERQELNLGLECIAAPVFNYKKQPQYALLLSFPYGTFRENRLDVGTVAQSVMECAQKLSSRLGYHG